jgi:tRNA modification GTPase
LIIFVADGSRELDDNDKKIIDIISNKPAIILINKSDMNTVIDIESLKKDTGRDVILFSAKEGEGMDLLENEIRELFYSGKVTYNDQLYITNARHKEALDSTYRSLCQVKNSVEAGMPEDFYSIDLMDAYADLGLIIGESVEDDLVNEIFSKFCMGK